MRRAKVATAILPLILSLAAAVLLLVLPCFQMSESKSVSVGGETSVTTRQCHSLLEATDNAALSVLLVPVAVAALYFVSALRRWRVAGTLLIVLLGLFVVLTGFSIGLFFAPAALSGAISLAMLSTSSSQPPNGVSHN